MRRRCPSHQRRSAAPRRLAERVRVQLALDLRGAATVNQDALDDFHSWLIREAG